MTSTSGAGTDAAELARLAAVRTFGILDTPSDGAFDRVAAIAARTFGLPIGIAASSTRTGPGSKPRTACLTSRRPDGRPVCARPPSSMTARGS